MASWEGVVFLVRLGMGGGGGAWSASSSGCLFVFFLFLLLVLFLLMLFRLFVRLASVIFIMVVWSENVCPSAELRVSVIWLSISLVLSPETEQTWW